MDFQRPSPKCLDGCPVGNHPCDNPHCQHFKDLPPYNPDCEVFGLTPEGLALLAPHPPFTTPTALSNPPTRAVPESSSLDTTETTVRSSIVSDFLKAPPPQAATEQSLWDNHAIRFRHAGWATIRSRIWASLKRTGQTSGRVSAFAACGGGAYVQKSKAHISPVRFRIAGSCCHDRLCTPCANARSFRLKVALLTKIQGKKMKFITLTLSGKRQSLGEMTTRLYKHFRALRLHPLWAERIKGGAAFLEIKHNAKSKRWHPHLHIICHGFYIDQGELSDVWRGITKDSFIVDVRPVKDDAEAAGYVTKYASKPLHPSFTNDPELLDEAVRALKGKRLATAFGDWYGTPLDFDDDETCDPDDLPSSAFENLMPLYELLERANSADAQAMDLLRLLNVENRWRATLERPPDSPPV